MKPTPPPFRAVARVSSLTDFSLYIHVPFCLSKCRYCDFYSLTPNGSQLDSYTVRVKEELKKWGARNVRPIDTLYLGGGTPSLLGGKNIAEILSAADAVFGIKEDAEITLECNPGDDLSDTLKAARKAGVNRLSVGVQSGCDQTLEALGRRHSAADAEKCVRAARQAGFDNISLDLMLGLPESDEKSVRRSIDFITSLDPEHISVYMLKIEPSTPFGISPPPLPDEDSVAEQYLFTVRYLKEKGYDQYELSNFCKNGMESRHNKNYWLGGDYLGIGPSAHSFYGGRRFYYPRDLSAFMHGCETVPDGEGGTRDEFVMLRLRLCEGFCIGEYEEKFGPMPQKMKDSAARLAKAGLMRYEDNKLRLTTEGFLVSNAVIGELL